MTFARPPAGDDPLWPRASAWLARALPGPDRDTDRPDGHTRQPDRPTARLVVAGVPTSVGSISPSEAWRTPEAVRAALARLSPFDAGSDVDLGDALAADDLGDWPVAGLDLDAMVAIVHARAAARRASDSGSARPAARRAPDAVHVFVGGDNAITRPLLTGLLGPDLSRVGLLTLDAHHDVRHLDDGPRNGTPVRGLVAEDGLPGPNVVQVGLGWFTNSAPYARWCADRGIRGVGMEEVDARGLTACVADALETTLADVDAVYVDIDLDILDVAHAPACPGARPGGVTPGDLLRATRLLGAHPRVVASDLVEVDAAADHDGRTVMVTAQTLLAFAAGVATR